MKKRFLLCLMALMLVFTMVLLTGVMAPNANGPNAPNNNPWSESLPSVPAAIAIIVLVTAAVVTVTGQLVRRAVHLLNRTGYNILYKLRALTGNPLEWGKTLIKPILTSSPL